MRETCTFCFIHFCMSSYPFLSHDKGVRDIFIPHHFVHSTIWNDYSLLNAKSTLWVPLWSTVVWHMLILFTKEKLNTAERNCHSSLFIIRSFILSFSANFSAFFVRFVEVIDDRWNCWTGWAEEHRPTFSDDLAEYPGKKLLRGFCKYVSFWMFCSEECRMARGTESQSTAWRNATFDDPTSGRILQA